ncbi:hypothetical protein BK648_24680 [Pseudomonas poae]|uniref:Uncharacterized protein n=1 Tax=Pseudomonas poae TaxID=200451 RepID=A0A423ERK5_9PSED|nr:hypothetical protein BK648_24680 [Pseudomonas poae]
MPMCRTRWLSGRDSAFSRGGSADIDRVGLMAGLGLRASVASTCCDCRDVLGVDITGLLVIDWLAAGIEQIFTHTIKESL